MVQFAFARQPPGRLVGALFELKRKDFHGQAMRNLRQDAAVRAPRQSRQEPGEPEVSAQPADGPRDGEGPHFSGSRLHAMLEDLLGLAELDPVDLAEAGEVFP
jgi:hypothetical protein